MNTFQFDFDFNFGDLETIPQEDIYHLRVERDGARSYKAYSGAGNAAEMAFGLVHGRVGVWYLTAGHEGNPALVFLADRFMLTAWQQMPGYCVIAYSDR